MREPGEDKTRGLGGGDKGGEEGATDVGEPREEGATEVGECDEEATTVGDPRGLVSTSTTAVGVSRATGGSAKGGGEAGER